MSHPKGSGTTAEDSSFFRQGARGQRKEGTAGNEHRRWPRWGKGKKVLPAQQKPRRAPAAFLPGPSGLHLTCTTPQASYPKSAPSRRCTAVGSGRHGGITEVSPHPRFPRRALPPPPPPARHPGGVGGEARRPRRAPPSARQRRGAHLGPGAAPLGPAGGRYLYKT